MDLGSDIQKANIGIRISIVKKNRQFWFFSTQICTKMNFGVGISKIQVRIRNLHFQDTMCVNFQLKRTTLTFWAQICQRNLSLDLESASLRYYVYHFSDIRYNFKFLDPNFPKNGFWGLNLKNPSLDSESASLRDYVHQFLDKTDNFEFLGPNLAKNGFRVRHSES